MFLWQYLWLSSIQDHRLSTHRSKRRLSRGRQHDACYVVWTALLSAHFKLFYFRFVMRNEPKASYRTVQYKYAYRYTPNKYNTFVNCKVYDITIMRTEVNVLYCHENSVPKMVWMVFFRQWTGLNLRLHVCEDFRECLSVLRRCGERSDRKTRLHGGCVGFCWFWHHNRVFQSTRKSFFWSVNQSFDRNELIR